MKQTVFAVMLMAAAMGGSLVTPVFAQETKEATAEQAEAQAKVDSHLQIAIEVVEQTGNLPIYENQHALAMRDAKNWLIRQNPNLEKEISEAVEAAGEEYKGERDKMVKAVAVAWARYLKEDELKAILAFFKTEEGQKFANYQPRVIGESVQVLRKFNAALTRLVVNKSKEELAKKGHKFQ